jgi:carbonic anhydrase/acetyltransferase-like protein (isoleucine patch superfamily)
MKSGNRWAAALLVLPITILPIACGGDTADERAALRQDELARDLQLALRGDSVLPTFEDVPLPDTASAPPVEMPLPEPEPAAPPRVVQRPAADPPTQRPAARQPSPQPQRQQQAPPVDAPAPQPAPQPRYAVSSAPIGTTMAISLNETISTETSRPGDGFTATLQDAIRDSNGNTLVPAGATVRGRVTQVEKSSRVGETAVIKVAFESVSFGGTSYPLDASVIEANPQRSSRASVGEQAAKVGAGAAAGAVLGRVLVGGTRGAIRGAAIGAAAGTAIAMGTADVDAVLPSGSRMVIRLDAPIEVRRQIS